MSKEVFESIKRGLEEAIAYSRGKITLPSRQVESPKRLTKEKSTRPKKVNYKRSKGLSK